MGRRVLLPGSALLGVQERLLGTKLYPRLARKGSTVCCMKTCTGILGSLHLWKTKEERVGKGRDSFLLLMPVVVTLHHFLRSLYFCSFYSLIVGVDCSYCSALTSLRAVVSLYSCFNHFFSRAV